MGHVAIHERVENILGRKPAGRLLDVPAGEGALALRLKRLGFDVFCSDLYTEIFKLADTPIARGNLDDKLPFVDDFFDVVVCVEGLEHIENPANAVREFSRMLKNGGTLVISVPNIMNIEERLKWLFFGYTSHFKPLSRTALEKIRREYGSMEEIALHVNPIGYSELRFLLEKNGFELNRVHVDKPKKNSWAFFPLTALIKLAGKFNSEAKNRERWTKELGSKEVLLGGNTLIFEATLKK